MKIAIVGDGAVGFALAALMKDLGLRGIMVLGRNGPSSKSATVDIFGAKNVGTGSPVDYDPLAIDIWLFTTKAYQLKEAVTTYSCLGRKNAIYVCLSNGIAQQDFLGAVDPGIPQSSLRIGTTTFGAKFNEENTLLVTNERGILSWGPILPQDISEYEARLEALLPFLSIVPDPFPLIRGKWLANVAINCLSVHLGLSQNGDLLAHLDTVRATIREAYDLGLELWGRWNKTIDQFEIEIIDLIELTKSNENSTLRDLRLGRPLEAKWIVGVVNERGNYPLLQKIKGSCLLN